MKILEIRKSLEELGFECLGAHYRRISEEVSVEVFGNTVRVEVCQRFDEPKVYYRTIRKLDDILEAVDML